MKFAIITHVNHIQQANNYFGYAPYVYEMNIWFKYVNEVIIVAPVKKGTPTVIDSLYNHEKIDFRKVPDFSFTSFNKTFSSLFKLPIIFWEIFCAMKKADHIHLRCPGNVGLIGCFVQILFPNKIKTAKYAGNWDSQSKQPFTYNIQKWILKNTFLTRNMQVLVYGDWKNQSKNIKPFFTATYSDSEKEAVAKTSLNPVIDLVFVGSLVPGKNPLYAIKLIEKLTEKGRSVILNLYGDGAEKERLQKYIQKNKLQDIVIFHGNKNKETIKIAYKKSHFVILPSKSEGWPKAIAEAMFWGCVPIATKVSCVPFILDFGNRGVLLEMDLNQDLDQMEHIIKDESNFRNKSRLSQNWSQYYTLELFEAEIKKLLFK
ncbi:glycosyltransferase family 4 protein [Flavobacterium chungbukense]|uniref:Glycosyltransferase n=1 Tax=Flavobacterium chungbukense TaxID=877464 RepID=A0ABP7XL28_9FLAO|nr:glycosyltransferase [Flavobacterium chungbukense]MCC4922921.1 glycosyltransferase [Flavobacterium chungbukense]